MAPTKVWAKGISSSEMNVTWEPVQQDTNGILLGYEVSANPGPMRGMQCAGVLGLQGLGGRLTAHSSLSLESLTLCLEN